MRYSLLADLPIFMSKILSFYSTQEKVGAIVFFLIVLVGTCLVRAYYDNRRGVSPVYRIYMCFVGIMLTVALSVMASLHNIFLQQSGVDLTLNIVIRLYGVFFWTLTMTTGFYSLVYVPMQDTDQLTSTLRIPRPQKPPLLPLRYRIHYILKRVDAKVNQA
jgi:uncharacterized protein YacL